jgi:cytochrome P450
MAFDLFDPATRADPYPCYAAQRARAPVVWSDQVRAWVLLGHAEVQAVLRDDTVFSADRRRSRRRRGEEGADGLAPQRPTPGAGPPGGAAAAGGTVIRVVASDPPEGLDVRALLNDALVPMVRAIGPRIDALVTELLDGLTLRAAREATVDLVEDFAYALPIRVIAELLDVPPHERARFQDLSRAIARGMDRFYGGDDVRAGLAEIGAYFLGLLPERRERATLLTRGGALGSAALHDVDLVTRLLLAERQGDRLSDLEVVAMCTALVFGGHETTVNLIANGMLALLRHPDERRRLLDVPSLVPTAVEELLRYDSPPQFVSRVVVETTTLGGAILQPGDSVLVGIGAANRDPAAFDDPDRLDVGRTPNAHVAFGLGTHFCPGAQLSRLEARAALPALLARFPDLRLAGDPVWRPTFILRGLERLLVRLR